jgi:pSer/pThr/pTyr-binding forkhead associated (FHA) protein
VVGRSRSCDLVFDEDTISRRHAVVWHDGGTWRVVDLESTNGTYLNGERIEAARLAPGDEVRFGAVKLRFTT